MVTTPSCWGCCEGLASLLRPGTTDEAERERFERLISFLSTVPLLHAQVPPADLPKVASHAVRQVWEPDEVIVRAGEIGQALYIIENGEAAICPPMDEEAEDEYWDDPERELPRLVSGDYFGERFLTQDGVNQTATIQATTLCTTLCIKRTDLDADLREKLKLPPRRGFYGKKEEAWQRTMTADLQAPPLEGDDVVFLKAAIKECRRHKFDWHQKDMEAGEEEKLVHRFRKRRVLKGEELIRGADVADHWYVISKGEFDVNPIVLRGAGRGKSAETVEATDKLVEALTRKHKLLLELSQGQASSGNLRGRTRHSVDDVVHTRSESVVTGSAVLETLSFYSSPSNARRRLSSSMPQRFYSKNALLNPLSSPPSSRGRYFRTGSDRKGLSTWVTKLRRKASKLREDDKRDGHPPAFKVGERVAICPNFQAAPSENGTASMSPRSTRGLGCIVDFCRTESGRGEALVELPGLGVQKRSLDDLLSLQDLPVCATLKRNDTINEWALLYNARSLATVRAREDGEVFELRRSDFKRFFSTAVEDKNIDSYVRILDQVDILAPLLSAERRDLARNANGFVTFRPGEMVLRKGRIEQHTAVWYIVASGSCTMTSTTIPSRRLSCSEDAPDWWRRTASGEITDSTEEYVMGDFFGESFIMGENPSFESDVNVQAGPEGLVCLTFDAAVLRGLRIGEKDLKELAQDHLHRHSISRAMFKRLTVLSALGNGAFGEVLMVRHPSGQLYALKRIKKQYVNENCIGDQVRAEREILSILDSPFIVHFYQSHQDAQHVYMLLEVALGGDLLTLTCNSPEVLVADHPRGTNAKYYVASIICGLEYLHDRFIAYRDVKLENMLLNLEGELKLCDMGFARFVRGKTHTFLGTPDYMAPEIIDAPHAHNVCVDWWSLGVLTCELLTGSSPWHYRQTSDNGGLDCIHQVLAVRAAHRSVERNVQRVIKEPELAHAQDFVRRLLTVKPHRRLGSGGATEVKRHEWFAGFDFECLKLGQMSAPFRPTQAFEVPDPSEGVVLEDFANGGMKVVRSWDNKRLGELASSQCLLSHEGSWEDAF
mmetsp:Transcript_16907/g.39357  ORF Transcript_16907/g.39357 Transcript_16907/m.39357 type:complete len:1058 (-) Transcript_16907:58-3231(-)